MTALPEALKIAARRMGYRPMPQEGESELGASVWGKPMGYSLVFIALHPVHGLEWQQYFWHVAKSKGLCWTRKKWPAGGDFTETTKLQGTTEHYLLWIKECENWHVKVGWCGDLDYAREQRGAFEFDSLAERLGLL